MSKNDDYLHGLGANERALLERIPILPLRKFAAGMVRAKMRVQFTGWLQYLIPLPIILILALLALASLLLKVSFLVSTFSALGGVVGILAPVALGIWAANWEMGCARWDLKVISPCARKKKRNPCRGMI